MSRSIQANETVVEEHVPFENGRLIDEIVHELQIT